tara:strand:+ start:572 stop:691 length:120 start_codon:yes stop_codon:yes gene_type:complete
MKVLREQQEHKEQVVALVLKELVVALVLKEHKENKEEKE